MTDLLLHAGFHKTGTSSIQQFATHNRRRLKAGGVWYPRLWLKGPRVAHGHHALAHMLAHSESKSAAIVESAGGDRGFEKARRLVLHWRRQAIANQCGLLLSSEAICRYGFVDSATDGYPYLERWRELLSDFDVFPVLVIRRQDDFVRSLYQEHVVAGVGESARISFSEFMDRSAAQKPRFLERLRVFREQFGSVRVLVFEELADAGLPTAFFRELGLETLEGGAAPAKRQSLSVGETLIKQRLNKWIGGRYQNRLALMWLRSRPVQRVIERELGAVDTLWPDQEVRRSFAEHFDSENAAIAAEFLDRQGSLFPPLERNATSENPAPEARELDAATAEVVRAAPWRLQMILGPKAVRELSGTRDQRTEHYFESLTPSYSSRRYRPILKFLRKDAGRGSNLLDIGCGSGNVLEIIRDQTSIAELAGLDVSRRYLEQCASTVPGCRTHEGSILDSSLAEMIGRRYRYVMVGAVLHHLVGHTRQESRELARRALDNAWALVEPDGALIVMEPTFRPRWVMWGLFHIKRVVGRLTSRRVPLLGYWNNIGEPVVSYYSHAEMQAAVEDLGGEVIVAHKSEKQLPLSWRLAGLTERADSLLILRKCADRRAE